MPHVLLDYIPVWGIFLLTIIVSFIFFEIGFRLVKYRKKTLEHASEAPIGSIFAAILSLLAFILAFTFSSAATRYDERNKLVLEEAIAIEQTYFRASFLPEIYQPRVRELLKEYALVRLEGIHPENYQKALSASILIQDELWSYATKIGSEVPSTNANQSFVSALSDIIAAHAKRIMIGVYRHIPNTIWYALYFVTILAVTTMGYFVGIKRNRYFMMSFTLIVSFSAVITLIADLDRPQEGSILVSQQPMIDFYHRINERI